MPRAPGHAAAPFAFGFSDLRRKAFHRRSGRNPRCGILFQKKGKKEIGRVGKGVGAGGDKGGAQGKREPKREKGGDKGKGRFGYAPRDEKVIGESAADKVRSSRETVALATEVAQSGSQVLRASRRFAWRGWHAM